ncbi:hypothetical protein KO500_04595 [Cellulophaga baltica]|uniref:hypothetical protein n=1 Tax=Cellulophaga TaxID=104264 RepID=UPI001C07BC9A|nr:MULTISPECIES: hypothetical protein [Cellulophaga]MBU2995696.1 hypothetical protein [Cellulophaga baltica]MDO6767090.1 hypothetical protein [Cellulophaga sp. 1_MG-2023]
MRYFIIVLFFFTWSVNAQKIVQKTIINPNETSILVNADNCFDVKIETAKSNKIIVEAKMAGEYSNNLSLNIHEEDKTLLVETSFNANFEIPNDKLSAHKVVSIALKITVPENLDVTIYGTDANVTAKGMYKNINIALNDGRCVLNAVKNRAFVKTHSGTIEVHAKSGKFNTIAKYGEIFSDKLPVSNLQYDLSTITGNIYIHKIN